MAGQLRPARRRLGALVLLLALVLLAHGLLLRQVQELRQSWGEGERMPERMKAAFVRELVQKAPPPRAAPRVEPKPAPAPAPLVAAVAPAAAEPVVEAASEAASAPAVEQAPPAALAQAASEPVPEIAAAPASAAASAVAEAAYEPGPEWPLSTQLDYLVTGNYRGPVSGSAQVQWLREGSHYQVHLDVNIGPSFAPLISRHMSSDGQLTSQGIAPRRYDEDTKVLFRDRRRVTLWFDEGGTLRLADGKSQPAPPGVQDASSQFVHLTWLFLTGREPLRAGHIVAMPLALPRKLYTWRYEVLGEETLQTPRGPLDSWHLRPLIESQHRSTSDLKAEVWLAPSLQYLPVRLRIEQDEQTYLDLMLKAAPKQAER